MKNKRINFYRTRHGILSSRKLHDMKTENVLELMDDIAMNEHLADPEKATPHPRSDLPKNKHHDSIHST